MLFFQIISVTWATKSTSKDNTNDITSGINKYHPDPLHLFTKHHSKRDVTSTVLENISPIDSIDPIDRIKRDTTVIHRVRKRRPIPLRKRKKSRRPGRRPRPKPKPIYGAPQIHIHPPNFIPSGFGEPPTHSGPSAFSSPSGPSHSYYQQPATSASHYPQPGHSSQPLPPPPPSIHNSQPIYSPINQPSHSHSYQPHQSSNPYSPQASSIPNYQINYQSSYVQSVPIINGPSTQPPPQQFPGPPGIAHAGSSSNPTYETIRNSNLDPPGSNKQQVSYINQYRGPRPQPGRDSFTNVPTQKIPLDYSKQGDSYQNSVTSYDVPLNSYRVPASSPTQNNAAVTQITYNPPRPRPNYNSPEPTVVSSPVLPTHYELDDFPAVPSTVKSKPPRYNNLNPSTFFDDDSFEQYFNDVSESKQVNVRARPTSKTKERKTERNKQRGTKKHKKEKEDYSIEDFSEEFSLESYRPRSTPSTTTTTTTKRPRNRKRKRPKPTSEPDDLKDSYDAASNVKESIVELPSDEEVAGFESKKYFRLSKRPSTTPASTPITNFVLISSQNPDSSEQPTYWTKPTRYVRPYKTEAPKLIQSSSAPKYTIASRPKVTSRRPNIIEAVPADDDIDILSIQKSNSQSFYAGSETVKPEFTFEFPEDDNFDVVETGVFVTNNGYGTRIKHGRTKKHLASELGSDEDYTVFEAEYEVELPPNHRFF